MVNLDGGYTAYEQQHHNDNLSKVKDRKLKIIVRCSIIVIYNVQDLLLILVKKSKIAIGDQIEVVVTDHGF